MVNADAVFGDAQRPSGLWQAVGPARARSRGLDPAELPEYYRQRNLLKPGSLPSTSATRSCSSPPTDAHHRRDAAVDGGVPDAFAPR